MKGVLNIFSLNLFLWVLYLSLTLQQKRKEWVLDSMIIERNMGGKLKVCNAKEGAMFTLLMIAFNTKGKII